MLAFSEFFIYNGNKMMKMVYEFIISFGEMKGEIEMYGETAVVTIRMPKYLKEESSELLQSCGLTLSQGIQLFLHQCLNRRALPFSVIPAPQLNAETVTAIKEAEQGIGCSKAYDDVDEFLRDLYA